MIQLNWERIGGIMALAFVLALIWLTPKYRRIIQARKKYRTT